MECFQYQHTLSQPRALSNTHSFFGPKNEKLTQKWHSVFSSTVFLIASSATSTTLPPMPMPALLMRMSMKPAWNKYCVSEFICWNCFRDYNYAKERIPVFFTMRSSSFSWHHLSHTHTSWLLFRFVKRGRLDRCRCRFFWHQAMFSLDQRSLRRR